MTAGDQSSASIPPPKGAAAKKLAPTDVQYLAFEGGGGKGFAYLGAIDVLEKPPKGQPILPRIKGFSGASAGAITAFLLSIGYKAADLEQFLHNTKFDKFYDPPAPRTVPDVATDGRPIERLTDGEDAFLREGSLANVEKKFGIQFLESPGVALAGALGEIGSAILVKLVGDLLNTIILSAAREKLVPAALANVLTAENNGRMYLAFLPRDMGLFSGQEARHVFEGILQKAAVKKHGGAPEKYANMTFKDHYAMFRKELLVTGTNLRSGKTQLFSRTDTPRFPVSDAVRISMSLPWVFKPYVITAKSKGGAPCGVYVDGGVWNNLPFREFDSLPPSKGSKTAAVQTSTTSGRSPRTLGLRLEIEPAATVDSVLELTWQMLSHGLLGSGETQVLDKYVSQCILLDTRGLDLLTFAPPTSGADTIRRRSSRAVYNYFDWPVPVGLADKADDDATARARAKAEAC